MSFEALTASRRLSSFSIVEDTRTAVDRVLGVGAVDFSAGDQSGVLHLLSEEELAEMHMLTGALGDLSVPKLVQTSAAFIPGSFKSGAEVLTGLAIDNKDDGSQSLVMTLSRRGRFVEERNGITGATEHIAGADIPWRGFTPGIELGMIDEGAVVGTPEIVAIKDQMPVKAYMMRGQAEVTAIPLELPGGEMPLAA